MTNYEGNTKIAVNQT